MDKTTFKHASFSYAGVSHTSSRGSAGTFYVNQRVVWQGQLSDAARMEFRWLDAVDVTMLPKGNAQLVVNKRKYYDISENVNFDTIEHTDTNVSVYGTNLIDGVVIQPTPYSKKADVTKYGQNQNIRDLVQDKVDELSYGLADRVDKYIAAAIGAAGQTTSDTSKATLIYAGSAVADSELTGADVLTTELVNRAETILSDKFAYYWNGGVFTKSTGVKNPWSNEATDPFVLMIGPKQRKAFRDSSEFMNVSQYGSNVVISTGEIGSYIGIRIIVTNNVQRVAAGGTAFDGGSVPSVDIARCILMKGRKAFTFVWGQAPTFYPWFNEQNVQSGVTLYAEWAGKVVHEDAIVKIDVADSLNAPIVA